MDGINKVIYEKEVSLLKRNVRESAEKVSELLDESFTEHCSSGNVYIYKSGDTFDSLGGYKLTDFKIRMLCVTSVLATYELVRYEEDYSIHTLRSSIWNFSGGKWKMVFHQGTICND